MKWFRSYSDAVHNAKLIRLTDEQHRFWFNLLCIANNNEPRGLIPSADDVATVLRKKLPRVTRLLEGLIQVGLLDRAEDGSVVPHNWEQRQRESDNAAERMRKIRGRRDRTCSERVPNMFGLEREREREEIRKDSALAGGRRDPPARPPGGEPIPNRVTHRDCVELVRSLWPDRPDVCEAIESNHRDLDKAVGGRWDCLATALRQMVAKRHKIEGFRAFAIFLSRQIELNGAPPPSVSLGGSEPAPALTREEQARRDAELMERIDVSKLY